MLGLLAVASAQNSLPGIDADSNPNQATNCRSH